MRIFISLILLTISFSVSSQDLTGSELLDKAIAYHDPNGNWTTFNDALTVIMATPNNPNRRSDIKINLPEEFFHLKATRDTIITEYILDKKDCEIRLNGLTEISKEQLEKHKLSCERANMYKNYYTYLYGLPMKLKDPGTHIHDTIERKTFNGKDYLVLKVTYDKAVGSDIWFFYFRPDTYAMEVYQFFKTDDSGKMKPGSGEYIELSGEVVFNDIKMPKTRAWYYNKDSKYLGTDVLNK